MTQTPASLCHGGGEGAHQAEVGRLGAHPLDGDEEAEELVGGGHGHVEGQHLQEQHLHAHQLPVVIGAVRDVHKVLQLGGVDLLVFPGAQTWGNLRA